jgi:hypothetical protein
LSLSDQRFKEDSKMSNPPRSAIVAIAGLTALVIVVAVGYTQLPDGPEKGSQVVALSSAGFGVIGAIVGAYFGVNASQNAARDSARQALQISIPEDQRRIDLP